MEANWSPVVRKNSSGILSTSWVVKILPPSRLMVSERYEKILQIKHRINFYKKLIVGNMKLILMPRSPFFNEIHLNHHSFGYLPHLPFPRHNTKVMAQIMSSFSIVETKSITFQLNRNIRSTKTIYSLHVEIFFHSQIFPYFFRNKINNMSENGYSSYLQNNMVIYCISAATWSIVNTIVFCSKQF